MFFFSSTLETRNRGQQTEWRRHGRHSGSASVPNGIYFGRRLLRPFFVGACAPSPRSAPLGKSPERIYTNVARWSPHQFRVVSPTRSKSVSLICIHLLIVIYPNRSSHLQSRSIPYGYLGFFLSLFPQTTATKLSTSSGKISVTILILIPS